MKEERGNSILKKMVGKTHEKGKNPREKTKIGRKNTTIRKNTKHTGRKNHHMKKKSQEKTKGKTEEKGKKPREKTKT
jgi:hypothetical protein